MNRTIFVFGSNRAGRHGKGAAKFAKDHYGAIYGQGEGLQGNAYALPTKDENLRCLSLEEIDRHIGEFIGFAHMNPDLLFLLTPVGTGLAGHSKIDILRLIKTYAIPRNVVLTKEWIQE